MSLKCENCRKPLKYDVTKRKWTHVSVKGGCRYPQPPKEVDTFE